MSAILDRTLYALRLKKRPEVYRDRSDVLQSAPLRNPVIKWETDERDEVSLIIPADQKRTLRWLVKIMDLPKTRVVALDAVGSFVWLQCDGEQTFEDISHKLSSRFGMTRREAEASLAEFFRSLGKRGMLGFVVPDAAKEVIEKATQNKRKRRKGRRR